MKGIFLGIICTAFALTATAQDQPVKVVSNGTILVGNDAYPDTYTLPLNSDGYIVAWKEGFITKAESADHILRKNASRYDIVLKPAKPPKLADELKKIQFIKFTDKNSVIAFIQGTSVYTTSGLSPQMTSKVNSELARAGYNVIDEDGTDFKGKAYTPDLAITGEVAYFNKKTKGIPGCRITLVIRWSVYNVETEELVYKTTTGGYSDAKQMLEAFQMAAKDAAMGLITDEEFAQTCNKNKTISEALPGQTILPSVSKPQYADNSTMIENSIKSVITVKTGTGHGSGFLISEDGYVLTNYHVIKSDSSRMEAIFNNGLKLPLSVVASSEAHDVALLKINGGGFAPMPLDTTDAGRKIGSEVIAIGTPESVKLGQTVTKGIISGTRQIEQDQLIQTDVSINPGNSGGALVNKNGQAVGIVVAKIKGEGVEGLGFAIPISVALHALNIRFK
ncbi:S1C family serine protease [Chitinophagaceae bacterium MMS25-I14]